jgi:DNA-binding SARP family transcriptional activator/TolB-like protein/Flp pilus assembly protein TadD
MCLRIHLFGQFHVTVDGIPVEEARWGRRKAKTLIKLLALQPPRQSSRQIHREEIIELLWPGLDSEQGLNNLHKAMHAARRAIEPGLNVGGASRFLQMRDQLVILQGSEISVDLCEFEELAEEALKTGKRDRLEAALAIQQGSLLPEDLYEDWAAAPRERTHAQREQLLLRLAGVCEASNDLVYAIEANRRLIVSNPCNEAAHRGLMRLYAAVGQRYLAVEQFRACTEVLRRELEADPEPATVSLYDRILAGATEAKPAPVTGPSVAEVPPQAPLPASPAIAPVPAAGRKQPRRLWYLAAAVVLVLVGAAAIYRSRRMDGPVQSIAIMPLATAADAKELDYLADGITESVIDDLSRLPQVRVMARSTVYSYRDKGLDPMVAAAQMKVHAVLTGTIAKRGDNLLVTAELVEVPAGTRLWGNQYELTAKDLITVQDRISSEIAESLELRLSGDERARLSPPHPTDPEAYRLYLQARFFWNQRSKEGYLRSIELFQAAISRDPAYARAYAGLSDSYSFLGRDEAPTREYMRRARAAAQRALAIDDKLAEAHASLAMMSNVYDWNFPAAERGFRRALELDPGYANARLFYGVFLAAQGDLKQAQVQLDKAAEIDPLSPIIALCRGYPASFEGRLEPAIQAAQEALEISPGFPAALEDLMTYFERQGRQEAAMQQALALLHAREQNELAETVQAAYRQSGYQSAVRTWLEAEEKRAAQMYVSPLRIALLAMRVGNMDKAFKWLDAAVEARNAGLVYLTIDPKYARLRSDPRFPAVCQRVGLKLRTR